MNDGAEVFVVLDGEVDMHYRVDSSERVQVMQPGGSCRRWIARRWWGTAGVPGNAVLGTADEVVHRNGDDPVVHREPGA